jgi:hypothetical protein
MNVAVRQPRRNRPSDLMGTPEGDPIADTLDLPY